MKTVRRILVVDDNVEHADSLVTLLTLSGHVAQAAYDGLEAITSVSQFKPDLILLDIGMPDIDGLDVCRILRVTPFGEKVRIVALTGRGQEEDRDHSAAAGFDAHLVKPVDYKAIQDLLEDTE